MWITQTISICIFLRLAGWFSVRLDDFISGIEIVRNWMEHFSKQDKEGKATRRGLNVYLQRVLFDGESLGATCDPFAIL